MTLLGIEIVRGDEEDCSWEKTYESDSGGR